MAKKFKRVLISEKETKPGQRERIYKKELIEDNSEMIERLQETKFGRQGLPKRRNCSPKRRQGARRAPQIVLKASRSIPKSTSWRFRIPQ